jgi:hypothetical protein
MSLNMERCDELAGEYLDGTLSPSGQEKLADLVRDDPGARRYLILQAEIAGLLINHFSPEVHATDLIERTMAALPDAPTGLNSPTRPTGATGDSTIDAVMSRISERQHRQDIVFREFAARSALETQAQLSRIPRFGRWMSFAALILLAASPMILLLFAQNFRKIAMVPVLRPVVGNVYVISPESGMNPERKDKERLGLSEGIAVDASARAALTYWDGTQMVLSGDAGRLWMSGKHAGLRDAQDRCLVLESGKLEVAAAKQHEKPLVLVTPHAEIQVVGTKFVLSVGADETRVSVLEGEVRFIRSTDHRSISVAANEYAVAAKSTELIARPLEESGTN